MTVEEEKKEVNDDALHHFVAIQSDGKNGEVGEEISITISMRTINKHMKGTDDNTKKFTSDSFQGDQINNFDDISFLIYNNES